MSVADYMTAAAEVAALAGANALRYYSGALDAEIKADGSPVTIADTSSEQLMREWVEKRFPEDGMLGEEFGATRPNAKRRWVFDPVDGTKAFIKRVPFWGSLVGVIEDDTVIAGAASFPALNETLVAGAGEGCWWNGARSYVSSVDNLAEATVLTTDCGPSEDPAKRERWLELASRAGVSRTWGDCVGYLLVATGRAEVMVDPVVNEWDIAALIPAIVEAGGAITDWRGRVNTIGGSAVATNAALRVETRRILGIGAAS